MTVSRVSLKAPMRMSTGGFISLDHLMLEVTADDGRSGHGEVTILPAFMGETMAQVVSDCALLTQALAGADAADLEALHGIIDIKAPDSRSARAAIDVACHDLAAQDRGVPLWELLGARARDSIECTWIVGIDELEPTLAGAEQAWNQGFRTLKIKLSGRDQDDFHRVSSLRRTLGPDVQLRLDANGAYTPERALRLLEKLLPLDIEMVEQPCKAEELDGMARLRDTLGVKVLADESVFSLSDVALVCDSGAADLINVKIQKLGGLYIALQAARLAQGSGIQCVIGSCLEVGPGVAAGAHFAVACPSANAASDLTAGIQQAEHVGGAMMVEPAPRIGEPRGLGLGRVEW